MYNIRTSNPRSSSATQQPKIAARTARAVYLTCSTLSINSVAEEAAASTHNKMQSLSWSPKQTKKAATVQSTSPIKSHYYFQCKNLLSRRTFPCCCWKFLYFEPSQQQCDSDKSADEFTSVLLYLQGTGSHRLDTQCSGTQSELTTTILRDQRSSTYFLDLPYIEVRTLAATARSSNQRSSAAPHSMYHQSGRRGSPLLVNEPPPPNETPYTSNPRSSHFTIQQANSLHSLLQEPQKDSTLPARHSNESGTSQSKLTTIIKIDTTNTPTHTSKLEP